MEYMKMSILIKRFWIKNYEYYVDTIDVIGYSLFILNITDLVGGILNTDNIEQALVVSCNKMPHIL